MVPQKPTLIPMPFAQNGDRHEIPQNNTVPGNPDASWNYGFPQVTGINKQAGGKPPKRLDFQGVLHTLSQHLFWLQSGGVYPWQATLNYSIGAIVLGSDNKLYFALMASGPEINGTGGVVGAVNPVSGAGDFWIAIDPVKYATLGLPDDVTIKKNAANKLYVALKSGGGIYGNGPGLYVNPEELIEDGGGLALNTQDRLKVDFNKMPPTQFKGILDKFHSELRVPFWLTEDMDFYVTQEEITNRTGKPGSPTNPFGNITAAIKYVCDNYNMVEHTATIHVASGEYAENLGLGKFSVTTGKIVIEGPAGISVQVKGYVYANGAGPVTFKNIVFRNISGPCYGTSYSYLITAMNSSNITLNNCRIEYSAAITSAGMQCIRVFSGSSVVIEGGTESTGDPGLKVFPYIDENWSCFFYIDHGQISQNCNCHMVGLGTNPTFTSAFAQVTNLGVFSLSRNAGWTAWPVWTGSASGKRYDVSMNSVVNIRGGGPNFFPGLTDGTTATGGQYS